MDPSIQESRTGADERIPLLHVYLSSILLDCSRGSHSYMYVCPIYCYDCRWRPTHACVFLLYTVVGEVNSVCRGKDIVAW